MLLIYIYVFVSLTGLALVANLTEAWGCTLCHLDTANFHRLLAKLRAGGPKDSVAARRWGSHPLTAAGPLWREGRQWRGPVRDTSSQTQITPLDQQLLGHHVEHSCGVGTEIVRVRLLRNFFGVPLQKHPARAVLQCCITQ